jgi:hypothetical protein
MNLLSNDTIKFINIINKHKIKNVNKITDNRYFMDLYNKMKDTLKNIVITEDNLILEELNEKSSNYMSDNQFTSDNIKKVINNLKYGYKILFDNNTIIYFTYKKIKKIPKIIIYMFIIIKLLKILFNRDINSQNIIYFETFEKKKFPKKKVILGPNEVNSALTYVTLNKNGNIVLFRKEEILKVLIHELIHSNLIDLKIILSNKSKLLNNFFCVDYNILLNEAFTETLATLINIFYIHINCKFKKNDLNKIFFNELKYSNYVCSKILKFYKIEKFSDVIKKNKINIKFPQKTNVFAYYILKNILLHNHLEFGNILELYTTNYKIDNEICIDKIIHLIINKIDILDKNIINITDNNKSLRLCLYELKL